ncbi:ABC transporter permease [Aureimonas populi]|uniref:ABC transporter permease n=1 Tax=Aureimonas populi TaxID=1701758 RepID=A0ABW5CN24_9HYPH|nr:ABC transporter permease [Aureimonas populi]
MSDQSLPFEAVREKSRRKRRRAIGIGSPWAVPALVFLMAFFVLPLVSNIVRSVTGGQAADDPLFYYRALLTDAYYLGIIYETVKVAVLSTAICVVIGYPISYFMVRYAGRWNAVIVFCLIAPLLTSIIMRTFGWTVLFSRRGLINIWLVDWGIIERPLNILNQEIMVYIGLVHVLVPFMVLSITAVLQTIDRRLEESAQVLGANKLTTFWRITLPLSMDGIATGCILVFVLTNGSFLTMLLLGGGQVTTLSLLIYQQFTLTQDVGFAAAMGNLLLLFALVCLVVQLKFIHRKGVAA